METSPTLSEFIQLSKQGNHIPVYREFPADTDTPVSAYLKIKDKAFSYLLESADGGERWGRYSFIGYKPHLIVKSRGKEMEIHRGSSIRKLENVENPLHILRELNAMFQPVTCEDLPPFQGGLVGYMNYDLIRKWERMPGFQPEEGSQPESIFIACGRLIIFDHMAHSMKVVVFPAIEEQEDLNRVYQRACHEVDETIEELRQPLVYSSDSNHLSISPLRSNFSKQKFEEAVESAKNYIIEGDAIQIVLSQRFTGDISGEDFLLYRSLRGVNPSPYMFYLNFGEMKLIGASPEILVRLTDGKIELRPIAGTRPRGKDTESDLALENELMADPKERAEHIMLVDLGRNDVGRVSSPGTVSVPRLMEVERYSHVMHIVSRVEGRLKPGQDCFDLFMATFPAGTVSGAPKIRAMEIIKELEPAARGHYAGAVGYFGFNGNMDFCITIRTIAVIENKVAIQVGAGIVSDSSPESEFEETLRKAAAMFKAIERAKDYDSFNR